MYGSSTYGGIKTMNELHTVYFTKNEVSIAALATEDNTLFDIIDTDEYGMLEENPTSINEFIALGFMFIG